MELLLLLKNVYIYIYKKISIFVPQTCRKYTAQLTRFFLYLNRESKGN